VPLHLRPFVIIQPGAAQAAIVQLKTERFDQV
jgi:hypothetical protein